MLRRGAAGRGVFFGRLADFAREVGSARKVAAMVAAMATLSGPAASLAAVTEVSGDVGGWLRNFTGYRGVFVFVDESESASRVITLWETSADELAARQARGAMRDRLMGIAGLEVVSFEVYEVPGHEYVGG
jgi:hypothetical protein